LPDEESFFLFPPLDNIFRIGTIVLCVLVTFVCYFASTSTFVSSKKGRPRVLWLLGGLCAIGLCLFLAAHFRFVRTIDIPALPDGHSVTVTIGFTRTEFANREFGGRSDWDMLHARGTSEGEIERLWTRGSILIGRLALLVAYLVFLLPAVATASLGVLYEQLGPPTRD
jgi:hypothetical protein